MFFDIFKALCDENNISPKRATTEIGLSNSLATKWKNTGATPSGDTLGRIATYFGVSADYLLSGDDKEKTPAENSRSSDKDLKFALWGTSEIDDNILDEVKRFAKFAEEQNRGKKNN